MKTPAASLRALSLLPLALPAQPPRFAEEKLHGRHAYVLSNGIVRASVLKGGGHIAELRFLTGDAARQVNPFRVPHYPTIEPYDYNPAKHDAIYGDTPHRVLHSGYMGHLLCFPFYGPVSSDEEARNGLGNHGEAPIVEWRLVRHAATADAVSIDVEAELRATRFRVGRRITLARGATGLRVEEWVENLLPFDRPVNWMQHATFGPPFAESGATMLDMDATRGDAAPLGEHAWPKLKTATGNADARPMVGENSGRYIAWLLDPRNEEHWFTLYNEKFPLLIGYTFPAADNPWLGDWMENRRNTTIPWNGQAVARGIEFGSTPYAEGLRKSIERGTLLGARTFRWIGGYQRVHTSFTVWLAPLPARYRGTGSVKKNPAGYSVIESENGRNISVSLPVQ